MICIDTDALVKLAHLETETSALEQWLSARHVSPDLESFVTYDKRLGQAAVAAGVNWGAPS